MTFHRKTMGFTLVELTVSLAMGVVLSLAIGVFMNGLFSSISSVTPWVVATAQFETRPGLGKRLYPRAPSYWSLAQAVRLHAAVQQSLEQADFAVIVGGARANPVLIRVEGSKGSTPVDVDSQSWMNTTPLSYIPSTIPVGSTLRSVLNSYDAIQVGGITLSESSDSSDFTLFTIQGETTVTSVTQVRRVVSPPGNIGLSLYDVFYYANPTGEPSPVPTISYAFSVDANEDNAWQMPVGAHHYWFRYDGVASFSEGSPVPTDTKWGRREAAFVRLVFPDPYVTRRVAVAQRSQPTSRFVYIVPTL